MNAPTYARRVRPGTEPGWLRRGWELGAERRADIGRARRPIHTAGLDPRIAATLVPNRKRQKQRRKGR